MAIARARQTLDIAAADVDVARSLGIAVNAPIAEVRCLFVAPDGTVLYVAEASYRGDYIHLEMDLLQSRRPRDDRSDRHRPSPSTRAGRPGRRRRGPGRARRTSCSCVLDDCGFSQLGCYGASIRTPAIDRLAANGLRYTNFHVTAMCSPTRASLLTGRNHHAVGMGYLADFDTGFDNARGAISPRAATLAEMLREGGYGTYALGKWHLAPPAECSPVGPFRNWPTQRGFDRYYGFLGGEDDQYAPELWEDQHFAPLPDRDDYHLSEDLVDKAQAFLADHVTTTPDRPFFLYLAFGACHAPHQAPPGLHRALPRRLRRRLGRRAREGARPAEGDGHRARRTPCCPTTTPTSRPGTRCARTPAAVLCRMQEVFAGFTTHTDAQIGRLVDFLERRGLLDNTLFVVMSDNGASGEGGAFGSENEYRYFLGLPDTLEENRAAIDRLGGPLDPQPLSVGMGAGGQHAAQDVQEVHLRRRHPRAP